MIANSEFQERVTRRVTEVLTKTVMFVILVTLLILVFSEIVMHLWNWLMPMIFHLPVLGSFWQALGLMVLSWLLFGGLRGFRGPWRGRGGHWRGRMQNRMRGRWEQMTPEEREKFWEWIRTRCGPAAENPTPKA
jgi:hypothetical protein